MCVRKLSIQSMPRVEKTPEPSQALKHPDRTVFGVKHLDLAI
jgi:hypothetical protein